MRSRQVFKPADRIRRRSDYQRVYDRGRKVSSRNFTLFLLENDLRRPRLGITATRRAGGAVQRNRAKRLLREWFRKIRRNLPPVDLVVNVKEGFYRLAPEELSREIEGKIRQSGPRKGGLA